MSSDTTRTRVRVRDALFSEIALGTRRVTPEGIQRAKAAAEEMGRIGISPTLSSILVNRKIIDRDVEREVMREIAKIAVNCPRCRKEVSLKNLSSENRLRCESCKSIVELTLDDLDESVEGAALLRIDQRLKATVYREGDGRQDPHSGRGDPGSTPAPIQPILSAAAPSAGSMVSTYQGARVVGGGSSRSRKSPIVEPTPAAAQVRVEQRPIQARLNPKAVIRRYRIDGVLSSGPYGRLYRAAPAEGGKSSRALLLKVFEPNRSPDARSGDALKEHLEIWTRLNRENPDLAHSLEREESLSYIARPHLTPPWIPLSEMAFDDARKKALVLRNIVVQLKAAHQAGFIHGNLKPSNIFIHRETGKVNLIDPGLHLLLPRTDGMLRWKILVDAPRYRTPEEISGEDLSPATDIYSLGWIFHLVLTGNPPFSGLTAPEILRRHREGPCPDLPAEMGEWRRLLSSMTAFLPRERPRDAAALLEYLETILAGKKAAFAPITPRIAAARIRDGEGPKGMGYRRRYALGPVALALTLAWTGWCLWQWRETRAIFSMPDRMTVLHQRLATRAYQEALSEARENPENGRGIWERYLEQFSGTPLEGAAKVELSNFPAPIEPRGR